MSGVDRIVLQNDGGKGINTEIKVDSEVYKIFRNARYSGSTFVSDANDYSGICYFKDGISGTISISKKSGDILIFVSDDYTRHFTFNDGFDRIWLNYVKSKIG